MLGTVPPRYFRILLLLTLIAAMNSVTYASIADNKKQESIFLSSKPLRQSLEYIAEKFGVGYVAEPSLIQGEFSSPVSGRFTLEEALEKVLNGTGLTFTITRNGVTWSSKFTQPS